MKIVKAASFVLVVALLTGCGGNKTPPDDAMSQGFDAFNDEIRTVVTDPARADRAIELVTELERQVEVLEDRIAARELAFRKINADYDATEADFREFLDGIDRQVRENKATMDKIYRELYRTLNAAEREELEGSQSAAIKSAITAINAI